MSKLVQSGYNPKYPKVIEKYWPYTEESEAPAWLRDKALIERIDKFPVLSVEYRNDGGLNIRKADINSGASLVSLETKDSIVYWTSESGFGSLTPKQIELLYEEEK